MSEEQERWERTSEMIKKTEYEEEKREVEKERRKEKEKQIKLFFEERQERS